MTDRITIAAYRTHAEGRTQITLSQTDENGRGRGYRLAGPKHYNSGVTELISAVLDERDAREIRAMLAAVFPADQSEQRNQVPAEAADPTITYGRRYGTLHRTLTTHLPPAHAEAAIAELAALLTAAAQMHHALGTVQAITVLRQHGADPAAIDLLLTANTGQEG